MVESCYVGVDVGLTSAKASAYDCNGIHVKTVTQLNPRHATQANYQEVDMLVLWATVELALRELSDYLESAGYVARGIGVTGSGNGLYPVSEELQPTRWGIASTDTRAEGMVADIDPSAIEILRMKTGSRPWSAQTPVVLKWLSEYEPESLQQTRWILSSKDWITSCLTGLPTADLSDGSAAGLVNLSLGVYEPGVFRALELDVSLMEMLPRLSQSDEIVGVVRDSVAKTTGLASGTPVIAGSIDVVAAPIGAGSVSEHDVTIIAGTWGINSVVHRLAGTPPDVTLSALFTEPGLVFAQEDAPTSMGNMEWFAQIIRGYGEELVDARRLVEDIKSSSPGARGLLFIPFIYGAPHYPGASAALLGQKGHQLSADISRAIAEGITQYHRVQIEALRQQGVILSEQPWTLAGGGARNPVWAQIFANVLGHPVKLQLEPELGSRGIASLAFSGTGGDADVWRTGHSPAVIVQPDDDCVAYRAQAELFDDALERLSGMWSSGYVD